MGNTLMRGFIVSCVLAATGLPLFAQERMLAQTPAAATFGLPRAAEETSPESTTANPATPFSSLLIQPLSPPAQNPESRRVPLSVFWDDGLRFESNNDQFHLHLGGAIQVDST